MTLRRWIAAAVAAMALIIGTAACGSSDNGGVIQGPTTTAAGSTGRY
jgi:hypothetical protein